VGDVLQIYIKRAQEQTITRTKIGHMTVLFEYLLTAEVKPLLCGGCGGRFNKVRNMILKKIHEFKTGPYILKHAEEEQRFIGVLDELFAYMVGDDTVARRRSVRVREKGAEYKCVCGICVETAGALRAARAKAAEIYANQSFEVSSKVEVSSEVATNGNKQEGGCRGTVPIKVKVLPRRSARLMAGASEAGACVYYGACWGK
jgi:hypothetical protein